MNDKDTRSAVIRATNYAPSNNWWLTLFLAGTDQITVPYRCEAWYCDRRATVLHKDHGFLCAKHLEEATVHTVPTLSQFNATH